MMTSTASSVHIPLLVAYTTQLCQLISIPPNYTGMISFIRETYQQHQLSPSCNTTTLCIESFFGWEKTS